MVAWWRYPCLSSFVKSLVHTRQEALTQETLTRLRLRDAVLAHQDRLDRALGELGQRHVHGGRCEHRSGGQQQGLMPAQERREGNGREERPAWLAVPAPPPS